MALRLIFMSGLFIYIYYIVLPLYLMLFGIGNAVGVGAGITNNRFTVILLYATTSLSFSIYLMSSYFTSLSASYEEAAKIDGAGNFTLMVRIMFPLVASTYFTVLLLNFITFWNDYQIPLIYIRTRPTVAYGLFLFNLAGGGSVNTTPMKLAGSFLVMLPILIVFLVFQKRLMGNIHMGGLKE